MSSHTLTHAMTSQSGAIKATGGTASLENWLPKLNELGYIDGSFIPPDAKHFMLTFSRDGITTAQYLKVGEVYTSLTGARLPVAANLIGISIQNSVQTTWGIEVRKNESVVSVSGLLVVGALGTYTGAFTPVAFAVGDRIHVFVPGTATDPVVLLRFEEA